MSQAKIQFEISRKKFLVDNINIGAVESLKKVTNIINELAQNFNGKNGGELADCQIKLAGYKFYFADYIADLMNHSQYLSAYIKDYKAQHWNEVHNNIELKLGKVKNKELVENELLIQLKNEITDQLFYESEYNRIKLKSMAIDDILTAVVQRLAELKREASQSYMNK